jgi:hypothetical protein
VVANYPITVLPVGNGVFSYAYPSGKNDTDLSTTYKGARFLAAPMNAEHDLYMAIYEIRDGKVANQWVTPMYRSSTP